MQPSFTKLDLWNQSLKLTDQIYSFLENLSQSDYVLKDQLRRSSLSVGANIAEGSGRFYFKDKIRFFYQARGSITETQHLLYFAQKRDLIRMELAKMLIEDYESLATSLNKLIHYLKTRSNQLNG